MQTRWVSLGSGPRLPVSSSTSYQRWDLDKLLNCSVPQSPGARKSLHLNPRAAEVGLQSKVLSGQNDASHKQAFDIGPSGVLGMKVTQPPSLRTDNKIQSKMKALGSVADCTGSSGCTWRRGHSPRAPWKRNGQGPF